MKLKWVLIILGCVSLITIMSFTYALTKQAVSQKNNSPQVIINPNIVNQTIPIAGQRLVQKNKRHKHHTQNKQKSRVAKSRAALQSCLGKTGATLITCVRAATISQPQNAKVALATLLPEQHSTNSTLTRQKILEPQSFIAKIIFTNSTSPMMTSVTGSKQNVHLLTPFQQSHS